MSHQEMINEMKLVHYRVAIFGSARIKPNDDNYKTVQSLAHELGSLGIDVVTGGGPGLMEAANKGHHEGRKNTKTHSLGVNIKLPFVI